MAEVAKGTIVLTKGVPSILFTATGGQLPGIFSAKISANDITLAADTVNLKMETKYDTPDPFEDAENRDFIKSDAIIRTAPVEETYGFQLTLELLSSSTSATVTLSYNIFRSAAPA
jgi:hypothetical protein